MLSSPSNKQRLQAFLQDEINLLSRSYPNVKFVYSVRLNCWNLSTRARVANFECCHIESDTILFITYSQIRQSSITTDIVTGAEDIDILVLSALAANSVDGVLVIKQKQNIIDCRTLCLKDVAEIIVPLHIHSGSDTTAFFGHGKATVSDKGISHDACALLSAVGKFITSHSVCSWWHGNVHYKTCL